MYPSDNLVPRPLPDFYLAAVEKTHPGAILRHGLEMVDSRNVDFASTKSLTKGV